MAISFTESIPICAAFAFGGGVLEVFATAVLAYPAARILQGHEWSDLQLKGCLLLNVTLQIVASLSGNLFATWFGPISIVGPIFFASQLIANLVVFWIVLGLEAFSREMRIGTYVVATSVILIVVNGPETQDYAGQTFQDIMSQPLAYIWFGILSLGMLVTGLICGFADLHKQQESVRFAVLLTARATAFSLNLTTGKALVMPTSQAWLIGNIVMKVVSGTIYTRAIVVQSTAVSQKTFVPVNAVFIIFVNALTGIMIWQDWRVIPSWLGYICVFLLMALGCMLLLGDLGMLEESAPETFRAARPSMLFPSERKRMLQNLKNMPDLEEEEEEPSHGEDARVEEGTGGGAEVVSRPSGRFSAERPHLHRASLLQRSTRTQAAWAAVYENGHAIHQEEEEEEEEPPSREDATPGRGTSRPSLRTGFKHGSARGWESFRRNLVEAKAGHSQEAKRDVEHDTAPVATAAAHQSLEVVYERGVNSTTSLNSGSGGDDFESNPNRNSST